MNFVKTAFLPQNDVEYCLAGNGVIPFENELLKLGITVIKTNENRHISGKISNHADLAVNYCGNGLIFADNSQKDLAKCLQEFGFNISFINESVSGEYPSDCLLNCIFSDKYLICNKKCTSANLLNYAVEHGKKVINVKQGYVKCSVCPITETAYITDDESIYKALNQEKLDVLLIKKGSVRLKGFDYGFFGGCCGKISDKKIVFFGDIKSHSCYDNIKSFTDNYKIDLISLGNGVLTDIGSLIPISEKEQQNENKMG